MQHAVLDSRIVCAILEDGAFVAGDPSTGFTSYSYPNSPNAIRAWSLRGHRPDLAAFAEGVMTGILAGIPPRGRRRALRSFAVFHARNWMRLNQDPGEWSLPCPILHAQPEMLAEQACPGSTTRSEKAILDARRLETLLHRQ